MREEWRIVDRWWTDEPVDRRYFDLVLETGENAVVYRDGESRRGSPSVPEGRTVCDRARSLRATSSCTRTRRTRSSTARRCPRSSPRAPPSSATTRSRSPTTTASTARSSSPTPPSTSGCARSPARRSRSRTTPHLTLLCESRRGYENLCRILTDAHAGTRAEGRERDLLPAATTAAFVAEHAEGLVCLSGCARHGLAVVDPNAAARLAQAFPGAFYVELQRPYERGDARRNAALAELAAALGVPTVATGDVHSHHERRLRLQDALVAIRNRTSLDGCERERRGNHESVLLPPAEAAERLPADAAARTREVADRCAFDLTSELGYRYPDFSDGPDPADAQLAELCERAFDRSLCLH